MSRSAGISTGYEVLVDLCRRVAMAAKEEEAAASDPVEWYANYTGKPATYDKVLQDLTSYPEERVGLLRGYFEPSDNEREQGLKVPTAAHRSLASLVKADLIRVIITTNFDRLIEHALDELELPYVVAATSTAVEGALPLHLQRCLVVKLHGDYLDPALSNTPEELSMYAPPVNSLLDRVLDEYGLIVLGWSATYDPALRASIERARSRRFSSWWVDPGTLSEHAQRLIDLRQATVVPLSADTFLTSLAEASTSLAEVDRPAPQTTTLAAAAAKRALAPNGNRIALHDLLKEEISEVASSPQIARDSFPNTTLESYERDVATVESAVQILQTLVAISTYWGDRQTDSWWLAAITDFAERSGRPPVGGATAMINLTRYPGLLIFQTAAVAATAAQRWDLLHDLSDMPIDTSFQGRRSPASSSLEPSSILGGFGTRAGAPTGVEVNDNPAAHLRGVIKATLTQQLFMTDADFERSYDVTEYLLTVASYDWKNQSGGEDQAQIYAPIRYAGYQLRFEGWQETPSIAPVVRALVESESGPLSVGMFGGDRERFTRSADEFESQFQYFARQRRWGR